MAPYTQASASRIVPHNDTSTHNNKEGQYFSSSSGVESMSPSDSSINHMQHSNNNLPLRIHVEHAVRNYFATLDSEIPTNLYELILKEIELPLLTVVLEQTHGNQSKCAQILGFNRGTLRKKMKAYDLL